MVTEKQSSPKQVECNVEMTVHKKTPEKCYVELMTCKSQGSLRLR